jgi:hypothetical protein
MQYHEEKVMWGPTGKNNAYGMEMLDGVVRACNQRVPEPPINLTGIVKQLLKK